ncbi:hypothetical protein MHI27_11900 [Paenibacillus sp. FSL H8-0261]|uniref:hypothetical protein n=1 Tax=Paenibacillus sp. FSL H8-0261 TaxID=2921381 RepID=UPI00324BD735
MSKKSLDPVGVYATYSDLFGVKYDKRKLVDFIYDLPLGGIITVLSQMNSIEMENKFIRSGFIAFLEHQSLDLSNIGDRFDERILYTPQGLLSVWKWVLAHGDFEKINVNINLETGTYIILYLNLIISDYLYEDENQNQNQNQNLLYDFFSNINFNASQDPVATLARASILYDEVAREVQLFNKKEFIDINTEFLKKYGYTIKEYLAILFAIHTSFIVEGDIIKPSAAKSIDNFSEFLLVKKMELILEELSVNMEQAREWSRENISMSWNFQLFRENPLLKLSDGLYLSINREFLFEKVYNQLFYKIRECFSKESEQIISFIGRCFENYVDLITTEAGSLSSIPYEVISEFTFGGNRSPDCIIKLGNKLLAIEAKNRRLKLDSLISSNPETIQFDLGKMIEEPIVQLHNCMKKLSDRGHPILDGVDQIYLLAVTQGSIATLPPFIDAINKKLVDSFEIPIKAFYHMDIEEYEWLLAITTNKESRPLFRILDNKAKLAPLTSFKNFALKHFYSKKRLDFINRKFIQITDDFVKELAGERLTIH